MPTNWSPMQDITLITQVEWRALKPKDYIRCGNGAKWTVVRTNVDGNPDKILVKHPPMYTEELTLLWDNQCIVDMRNGIPIPELTNGLSRVVLTP